MNLKELENKTILITGSAKRIGKEIALGLSKYNPKLILHYRNSNQEILEVLEKVKKFNKNSYIIQCDFSNQLQVQNFIEKIKTEKIDIFINSASIFPKNDTWENFDINLIYKIFNVNLIVPSFIIRNCFDKSRKGIVINLIDASLKHTSTGHFFYRLSKYSLEKMTIMLAKELAPNIRVNGISPGAILPPAQLLENDIIEENQNEEEFYQNKLKSIPLKISGNPKYILETVEFIIQNDFLTGCIISVDGGEYL